MLAIPPELTRRYESRLAQQNVVAGQRPHYHKWLRYYLDFCHKYGFTPTDRQSLPAFQEKLRTKHQPETLCQQAGHAISLYWQMVSPAAAGPHAPHGTAAPLNTAENRNISRTMVEYGPSQFPAEKPSVGSSAPPSRSPVSSQPLPRPERAMIGGAENPSSANSARALAQNNKMESAEYKLTGASWVWVYDRLTSAIKVRHYSPKTLDVYKIWTQKFQTFTQSKDPRLLSMEDIKGFLSFWQWPKKSRHPAKIKPSMRCCFYSGTYSKGNLATSKAW